MQVENLWKINKENSFMLTWIVPYFYRLFLECSTLTNY